MMHVDVRRTLRKPLQRRRLFAGLAALFLLLVVAVAADLASRRIGPTRLVPGDAADRIVMAPPAGSRIDYRRFDERLARLAQAKGMVGLAVGVVEDGEVRFLKTYGVREPGSAAPVNIRTRFAWASNSKTVAATMIETLVADGRVRLDAPVADYRTSLRLPNGGERQVTVEDLLSHRTGLVKNAWDDRLEDGWDPRVVRAEYYTLSNLCRPGTCFAYQNIAYDAAHEIVEGATGLNYGDAVRRRLFAPLGMTGAAVGQQALEADDNWARPSNGVRAYPMQVNYFHVPAAGGVSSTIMDLALWLRAQMGAVPTVLSPRLLDDLHAPRVSTSRTRRETEYDRVMTDTSYALGFRNAHYDGARLIGHRGAFRGYRSLLSFDPARRVGVVALWNSESLRPIGIPLELYDMAYGRPAKDWLKLDTSAAPSP